MNDKKQPTPTEDSAGAVMPKGVGDLAKTGEDVNAISETADGDGQHKIKKEVKEATDLPQKGSA